MSALRAAGVVCAGFDGDPAALAADGFAGVVLFARNAPSLQDARTITDRVRETFDGTPGPPMIAIDQEGGSVARLTAGVEVIPSMLAVGSAGDADLAFRAGAQTAFDLRRAGVNVDFAPVLDLARYAENEVIGARAFGEDPEIVVSLGGAFARGLESRGVTAVFKHFPGHGSTRADSHLELPRVTLDETHLRRRDFVPFEQLLPGARAVMSAHIVVEALDPERPATLSPRLLQTELRGRFGFRGVCFTDCLEMDAIAATVGSAAGAAAAIAAGADVVLVSHDTELARRSARAIDDAVASGAIPAARLEEALERVRVLRAVLAAPLPPESAPPYAGVGLEIARRALRSVRGTRRLDPASALAIGFGSELATGAARALTLPAEPEASDVTALLELLDDRAIAPIVGMRRAHRHPAQAAAVRAIAQRRADAIGVSLLEPYDAPIAEGLDGLICTYGDRPPNLQALSEALFAERR